MGEQAGEASEPLALLGLVGLWLHHPPRDTPFLQPYPGCGGFLIASPGVRGASLCSVGFP